MSARIFNRAEFEHPVDGWYMIEPTGTHPNHEAGVDLVLDGTGRAAIVDRFNADAAAGKLSHGREMLIDREHFKFDSDKETGADGWLVELQNRNDGIYGKIRWTGKGQEAVDGGEYRFFSTEYNPQDLVVLNGGEPKQVRPMRLDGLTLTNMPRNKGGKPITNRVGTRPTNPLEAGNPRARQSQAVQRIAQLANDEQRSSGGSLASCYLRVMNREPVLCDVAEGVAPEASGQVRARETVENPAVFAGGELLRRAQELRAPGLSANLRVIQNRCRRLARMASREAGWDCLSDLEPVAREAYMEAVQQPRGAAQPESRWRPFFALLDTLEVEFPDLGYEGWWQQMKGIYPATFLNFVLSFDDQGGYSDALAPAPKTDQERWEDRRARIAQAAHSEAMRFGRPGPSVEQLAQNAVNEALRDL